MKNLLIASVVAASGFAMFSSAQNTAPFTATDLTGTWASVTCEKFEVGGQTSFLKRNFEFTPTTWELYYTIFADPACNVGLFSSRLFGQFALTGAAALPNTNKITWGQSRKAMTPLAPPILEAMNQGKCGDTKLPLGSQRDISITGCLALGTPNVQDYGQEYDLLKLEKGQLFTGLRGENMNIEANRPTKIFEFPIVRTSK
jgi:hypothetical protein